MVVARTVDGATSPSSPVTCPSSAALADLVKVEILTSDGGREAFAVHGGFVQVSDDKVTILSDVSEQPTRSTCAGPRRLGSGPGRARLLGGRSRRRGADAALTRAELRLRVAGA